MGIKEVDLNWVGQAKEGILDLWFIDKDGWRIKIIDIDGEIDGRRWL